MPTWKPFYDEVARRVLTFENRQDELLTLVREMQDADLRAISLLDKTTDGTSIELAEIDPFTFLTNFHHSGEKSRRVLWDFLRAKWNLSQSVPADFDGVPTVEARQPWFFPHVAVRKADDVSSLWKLARVAVESPASLSDELFGRCLDIHTVAVAKLTCGLFWLNAKEFLSLDSTMRAYLQSRDIVWEKKAIESGDVSAYRDLMSRVHEKLGSDYPQISADAWAAKHPAPKSPTITPQTRFWAGGHDFGKEFGGPQKDVFIKGNFWQADFHDSDQKALTNRMRAMIEEIRPGDEFAIKGCGAMNLQVHYIGRVLEVFPKEHRVRLEPLPDRKFYRGPRPTGEGAGNWTQTIVEVKRPQDIELIFGIPPESIVNPTIKESSVPPLNKILYGPPGTGKTYTTIEEAVRIIRGDSQMPRLANGKVDHTACKHDFDLLRADGRIGFATFHQSFSYEEFVEGIRPVLDDAAGSARYICRDGVLKDIALRALGAALVPVETGRVTFEQVWDAFIEQAEASPDWLLPGIGPSQYRILFTPSGNVTGENVKGIAAAPYNASRQNIELVWEKLPEGVTPSHNILYEIIGKGAHTNLIGAIVKNLRLIEKTLSPSSNTKIDSLEAAKSFLRGSQLYRLDPLNAPRFVLIIDEINRGNISKILGELITLLEEDKRLGAENALSVTLPTSGETFALPSNLFVIGTMNTADKSLALLDIALRRRFSFQEMPPRFEVCENLTPRQRQVLTELNIRLTQTRDREHRIGHAYFTGCKNAVDFDRTFHDKIVPLLQEFFYNDWDGLRFVLGESGNNGTFVRALPEGGSGRARTRWQWWFDVGAADFSFCDVLLKNYKLAPQTGNDLSGAAAPGAATIDEMPDQSFMSASQADDEQADDEQADDETDVDGE